MNEDSKKPPGSHASITFTVDTHNPLAPGGGMVNCSIHGCKECLQGAITMMLLHNPEFKDLINKSVRAANEIKGRTQN